jgi:hypothetical protein
MQLRPKLHKTFGQKQQLASVSMNQAEQLDGLIILTLPVIAIPTIIFIAGALEPVVSMAVGARRSRRREQLLETRARQVFSTLFRIGVPSVTAAVAGFLYFDNISLYISSTLDVETLRVLGSDNANGQFVQNFLIVAGTLFAILAGNAYADLYEQQELIFYSLYEEVTVAKLLLEQLTLIGQARPWYRASLGCMRAYLSELRRVDVAPASRKSGHTHTATRTRTRTRACACAGAGFSSSESPPGRGR